MTTVANLIATTRQQLYGMHRGEYNRLTSTITSSETALTFDFELKGLASGVIISIDDELMYVWSVSSSANTATVQRGWLGTTAAAHTAATLVEVSARFPQVAIRNALLEEIRSWPNTLYRTSTTSLSALTSTEALNLNIGTFYDIIDVRRSSTAVDRWARVTNYEIDRHADTGDFASGQALYFTSAFSEACDLQVSYTAPFTLTTFTDAIDVVATVGLTNPMLDIPVLGAAWRLLAPREVKRTFTEAQGESRHADEVPAGFTMQTAAQLKRLRDQRIVEESDRLARSKAIRW